MTVIPYTAPANVDEKEVFAETACSWTRRVFLRDPVGPAAQKYVFSEVALLGAPPY